MAGKNLPCTVPWQKVTAMSAPSVVKLKFHSVLTFSLSYQQEGKAAISIGLAFRKVNINNKNVTGSPKMRFTNVGWDSPRYMCDRVTRLGKFFPFG
jgi:hypothetical protein